MSKRISQRELPNDSGRILRELDARRSFVVIRNAAPAEKLRALRRHRLVDRTMVASMFRGAPAIERDRFMDDLDAMTDQTIQPRA